jgi:RNA polymerase sigma factor (sigma-70 family)
VRPFEDIVDEHGPTVLRVCRGLLGPVDSDDAWSETFLAALRGYPDLRADSNVRGWLVTIAHRKCLDVIRRRDRRPRPEPDLERLGATTPPADTIDESLVKAIAALPPKQRDAVVYHFLGDRPYREVGELLGTSTDAARRSAADGIAALRASYPRGEAR